MTDDPSATTTEKDVPGIDRRTLIRRAGVVGAVAWAAPVVLSTSARADAGSAAPGCFFDPAADDCFGQTACGTGVAGEECICGRHVTDGVSDGTTACYSPGSCGRPVCLGDSDCPADWVCVQSCCGQPLCAPRCGVDPGGLRTAGRAGATGTQAPGR